MQKHLLKSMGIVAVLLAPMTAMATEPDAMFFQQKLTPFLKTYCFDCHVGEDAEAELQLEKYPDVMSIRNDRPTWEKIHELLRGGEMPPEDEPRPSNDQMEAVMQWITETLGILDCSGPENPGRVTIRRLNRAEYAATIRDLLGVEFNAIEKLPADDVGYGFDNIGDVLTLSPLLMEKYLAGAEQIAEQAEIDPLPKNQAKASVWIGQLATRAFRRWATDQEVERLMQLASSALAQGESAETAARLVTMAVLVSPQFLFRIEQDPAEGQTVRLLNEFELATRLSYFLWSSMPDERLFDHASNSTLRDQLDAQIRRMLADPKSEALVDNFAGQWLQLRNLDSIQPDRKRFTAFDEKLRDAMGTETKMCFDHIMRNDRSVMELIDADYSFVNERLAKLYGLEGVAGDAFRRVSLVGTTRGGVITQASILAVTSNPTRTSPVKRGKWILENILGERAPVPPANAPQLPETQAAILSGSLRERMEQHRKDPKCSVCHRKLDAMGFAMENFDPIGAWRTKDGQFDIDPAGTLPDGQEFSGPAELKTILRGSNRHDFLRCITEKMLTFALGRGLEPFDQCAVNHIVESLEKDNGKFSTLVLEIVRSEPFQKRNALRSEP